MKTLLKMGGQPAARPARKRRTVFAGYTAGQLLTGVAMLGLVVWGMWVTRTITAEPPQRIVKANLSGIVGDYVQAQARSTGSRPAYRSGWQYAGSASAWRRSVRSGSARGRAKC